MPGTVKDKIDYSFVESNYSNVLFIYLIMVLLVLLPRLTKVLRILYLKYSSHPAESRYTKLSFFTGITFITQRPNRAKNEGLFTKERKSGP